MQNTVLNWVMGVLINWMVISACDLLMKEHMRKHLSSCIWYFRIRNKNTHMEECNTRLLTKSKDQIYENANVMSLIILPSTGRNIQDHEAIAKDWPNRLRNSCVGVYYIVR